MLRQPETYEQRFAQALRQARLDRGLTQAHVAAAIGQTSRNIQKLEAGEYPPRMDTWRKLSDFFGEELPIR